MNPYFEDNYLHFSSLFNCDESAWSTSVGEQNNDLQSSENYKKYFGNSSQLIDDWTVNNSIYYNYVSTDLLSQITNAPNTFQPRWSIHENIAISNFQSIEEDLNLENSAFFLDLGGPHSLAIGYHLAREHGIQPIPKINGVVGEDVIINGDESLATAIYLGNKVGEILGNFNPNANPAFVLDSHRNSSVGTGYDVSYSYSIAEFPTPEELKENGITTVYWVLEGINQPEIKDVSNFDFKNDMTIILSYYKDNGIDIQRVYIPIKENPSLLVTNPLSID